MCFSAQASFVAGSVLLAAGAVTLKQVRVRSELPYAAIPGLFGVQQLIEGGLWLALASGSSHLVSALTHFYAFFSHVLWPVFVPLAVLAIERVGWRRRLLAAFVLGGGATGLYLLYFLLTEPTLAQVVGSHIDYVSPHFYAPTVLTLYVLATCGSSPTPVIAESAGLVSRRLCRWLRPVRFTRAGLFQSGASSRRGSAGSCCSTFLSRGHPR
jgi:hypothetical protein